MQVHELKTWSAYFEDVVDGKKTFEIRFDDRGFEVGDKLLLREWLQRSEQYSGRNVMVEVLYMIELDEIIGGDNDYVVMSVKKVDNPF